MFHENAPAFGGDITFILGMSGMAILIGFWAFTKIHKSKKEEHD